MLATAMGTPGLTTGVRPRATAPPVTVWSVTVWSVIAVLAAGTYALKAAGPLLLGGRRLPRPVERVAGLLPGALLASLVLTQTFADGRSVVLDARAAGLAAAAVALSRRASFLVTVVAAMSAAALARAAA